MSPRLYVEGLIISVLFLVVWSNGYALTGVENSNLRNRGSILIPQGKVYLNNQGDVLLRPNDHIKFPRLNIKQRKFAVNPGYMSYYNPDFEAIEDERDLLEAALKKEEKEAEAVIKEEELLENVIQPESKSTGLESKAIPDKDYKTVQSSLRADEYALEPADSKKASSFSFMRPEERERVRSEAMEEARINDIYFTTIVAVSSAVAVFGIVGAGFCYHRLQKNAKATEDVEYPAYGVTGPGKDVSPTSGGDRKLAQNAQMYHYQHQKQQMIAFDSHQNNANRGGGGLVSDDESDDGEEGDYTVYECPGLATTGEMEVRNPLFSEDQTPKATSSMPPTQSSNGKH